MSTMAVSTTLLEALDQQIPELGHNFLTVQNLDRCSIEALFQLAGLFEHADPVEYSRILEGKLVGMAFYQPSTRTRLSFESAALRLGAKCLGFADPKVTRAGDFYAETLEDVLSVVSRYVDCVVLRHHEDDAESRAVKASVAPVISAGIGYREHPTQALGDVWTMLRCVGSLDGAVIGLVGEVGIRSLRPISMVLSRFDLKKVLVLPAPGTTVPEEVETCWRRHSIRWQYVDHVRELLACADVIETIGVRHPHHNLPRQETDEDRFLDGTPERFRITRRVLEEAGRPVPILHPGGRKDELDVDVDPLPQAKYFDEITNNLWMRMAVMARLLGPKTR